MEKEGLIELNSNQIKAIELDLLKKFIQICEENQLIYYLGGGTLLGAIRHKGFIPWDDDIDVMMPRPDYEKFLDLNINGFLEPYIKLLQYRDKSLTLPYAKLADGRTIVEEGYVDRKYSQHIWIDIFPIDGNPEDDQEYHALCRKLKIYRRILFMGMYQIGEGTTWFKRVVKLVIIPLIRVYGLHRLCEKIDRISASYQFEDANQVGCLVWGYGEKERVKRAPFMKKNKIIFEGVTCAIPSNYDEYLTRHYGNYMELPPEEQRVGHRMRAWKRQEKLI